MSDPLVDFTVGDDEIGPTLVHECGWYCTIAEESLTDIIASARDHMASHAAGAR